MKLIKYEDYQIKIADEAFLVKPIRKLFHQDRSERKERFWQQMALLYFCYSPASNYNYIQDEEERMQEVLSQEGITDFKPTQDFKDAVEIYKKLNVTPSQKLLDDCLVAANTVGKFLRNINLEEEDRNGKPKYQVSQVVAALKNVEGIVSSLQSLQKKVDQELAENSGKARGAQELSVGDIWAEQGI